MKPTIAICLLLCSTVIGQQRLLPDPKLTPGEVLTNVTVDEICQKGYANVLDGGVRDVPESLKRQVFIEYFGKVPTNPGAYEIDHLVSLEIGGDNSISNLWPQAYAGEWGARVKDKLEDRLHAMVCKGQIPLKQAQAEISTNWIVAYQKYLPNAPHP